MLPVEGSARSSYVGTRTSGGLLHVYPTRGCNALPWHQVIFLSARRAPRWLLALVGESQRCRYACINETLALMLTIAEKRPPSGACDDRGRLVNSRLSLDRCWITVN